MRHGFFVIARNEAITLRKATKRIDNLCVSFDFAQPDNKNLNNKNKKTAEFLQQF
jgi:hypothetical protein